MANTTEREHLRDALHTAAAMTRKNIGEVQRQITKLEHIYDNRKFGDPYVSQEQLGAVIGNWQERLEAWQGQLAALNALIEREGLGY